MTKPMIRIHDMETDKVIDREMNDTEYAEFLEVQAKDAEEAAKVKAIKETAIAKLAVLGLDLDDLKSLGF